MKKIVIVCHTHGTGHGAEAVLEALLTECKANRVPLVVIAPPGSRPARVSVEAGIEYMPLHSRRDSLVQNIKGLIGCLSQLRNCALIHAWGARSFESCTIAG